MLIAGFEDDDEVALNGGWFLGIFCGCLSVKGGGGEVRGVGVLMRDEVGGGKMKGGEGLGAKKKKKKKLAVWRRVKK